MKKMRGGTGRGVGVACLLALAVMSAGGTPASARPLGAERATDRSVDTRVEHLLSRMTLAEKIGQMTQLSEGNAVTGPGGTVGLEANIKAGNVGSVLNSVGIERIRQLQELAVKHTRLGIPLIFGLDVIHGYRTIFPIPLAESCSWDLAVIKRSAHVAAAEAASDGIDWTFAPMVDIARDPRWGRVAEGAGEDTYLGAQIARARVQGFQGDDLAAPDSVVACVKHFAAYGAVMAGREYSTVDISQRSLLETYLPPYKAAVQAGAGTVMSAFNEYDGVPCSINPYLLHDVLVKQWGFKGFVVSDWTAIQETVKHGTSADGSDAARQAANAGMHMDMQSNDFLTYLAPLVRAGKVPMSAVDDAVRRILRVKFEKGLFDNPYRAYDKARRARVMRSPTNLAIAQDDARRSIVLLKNTHDLLPLGANVKTIALVGPLADDRPNMLGTWAGQGDGKLCKSVLDGLQARGGVRIINAKGCDYEGQDRSGFDAAVQAAKQAEVVVAVLGERSDMSGEASSRANPNLPGVQPELLSALKATGKPVVLVLMNGRPLVIPHESEQADALLEAWHLGSQAGPAVTDVLFGAYNPSGKLVSTFPRAVGQIPLFYNHMNSGRPFSPSDHYTSHYMDLPNSPLYPFGYGLSYTHFSYSPLTLGSQTLSPGQHLTIDVTVKNDGPRDGEEVAQLYIRDLVGSVNRPVKELKGFRKVLIKHGQAKTLHFTLSDRDLAIYRRDMSRAAEAGTYKVWVGPNSESGSAGSFRFTRTVGLAD